MKLQLMRSGDVIATVKTTKLVNKKWKKRLRDFFEEATDGGYRFIEEDGSETAIFDEVKETK